VPSDGKGKTSPVLFGFLKVPDTNPGIATNSSIETTGLIGHIRFRVKSGFVRLSQALLLLTVYEDRKD
jgi:hypothetical protein